MSKVKKRILDKRYKVGADSGSMSHLSLPLPLRNYSVLIPDPKSPTAREKYKEEMKKKAWQMKKAEKLLKQKLNKK
jgi:hypothetical protein